MWLHQKSSSKDKKDTRKTRNEEVILHRSTHDPTTECIYSDEPDDEEE
jgi:hypothetical protein